MKPTTTDTAPLKFKLSITLPFTLQVINIENTITDNATINSIVSGLKVMGLYAMNYGIGSNSHIKFLQM